MQDIVGLCKVIAYTLIRIGSHPGGLGQRSDIIQLVFSQDHSGSSVEKVLRGQSFKQGDYLKRVH